MSALAPSDPDKGESAGALALGADRAMIVARAVAQLQAGVDRERNFKLLFERYFDILVRFFAKRGFGDHECQDLAQEAFLKIYKGIESYRSQGPFEGWLFQIAANVYRNTVRDRQAGKRQARETSLDTLLEVADAHTSLRSASDLGPLDGYLEKERLEVLARALAELPEQMRRCVVLRIHQELKYREIAAVMCISIETVKAHLYQARRRLRDELDEYFEIADLEAL